MSYYVDIIDQVLRESIFIQEKASRSSIILNWSGSDSKDGLGIVGSTLSFNFAHNELVDAKFIRFFTGDETRFKVQLVNADTALVVWEGYVVPDTYSEPYTNGVTFVEFTASCGLGRLKGKFLPADFYRDEKSIIAILCNCLALTGLQKDLFFNPAIENSFQKNYELIYIDTATFIDGSKKQDAYKILETLLSDMLCVCYQSDNRWNVEGYNQRHIRTVKAKKYSFAGVALGNYTELKLLKKITAFVTPQITMIPPYNLITVSHKRVPQSFPKTIAKESNEGWVVMSGVKGEVYATDWSGNNNYYIKSYFPNYANILAKEMVTSIDLSGNIIPDYYKVLPFDATKFVSLKNKIYLYKDQKMSFSASFKLVRYINKQDYTVGLWSNPMKYELILNDVVLYTNNKSVIKDNENLIFDIDGLGILRFEFIAPQSGLFDLKLFRPEGSVIYSDFINIEIEELKIEPVSFNEELVVEDLISEEFTIDKEIELIYSDDDTAFSNCFQLGKLKEATINFNTIAVPVLYGFTQDGIYYSVVDLAGANLVKDNINTTYYGDDLLLNLEVVYNYRQGEQMVIKTDNAIVIGVLSVRVYKNNDVEGSRANWLQWSDSVYKIETDRYGKTVANIIRRMYGAASEKIDLTAHNAVKFNDLILFHYVYMKQFVVTNCSWNIDQNRSTLTLARGVYKDSGNVGSNPENVPPIVNAGPDIYLDNTQTSCSLTAIAYDPDGDIESQIWTKQQGGFGDVIVSQFSLSTAFENLTEDIYKYQIQVTDNDGATAIDTVTILRKKTYTPALNFISQNQVLGGGPDILDTSDSIVRKYQFVISPVLNNSFSLILKGKFVLKWPAKVVSGSYKFLALKIIKNGSVVYQEVINANSYIFKVFEFSVSYIATDTLYFETTEPHWQGYGAFPDPNDSTDYSTVELDVVDIVNGIGTVTGLPIIVW